MLVASDRTDIRKQMGQTDERMLTAVHSISMMSICAVYPHQLSLRSL